MKVEIENIREVREVLIGSDGRIHSQLPEYAGYAAKIFVLDYKDSNQTIQQYTQINKKPIENHMERNRIEGKRYQKGQKRTRETAKQFVKFISNGLEVKSKTQSWIYLKNGLQIRYANSVVYERDDGDLLWYSFSYEDLSKHLKKGNVLLAFIVRDSRSMVYLRAQDVTDHLKRAKDLRNNDWLHIHLIFTNGKVRFHVKTGKDNKPIEKEFNRDKHYVNWHRFVEIVEEG